MAGTERWGGPLVEQGLMSALELQCSIRRVNILLEVIQDLHCEKKKHHTFSRVLFGSPLFGWGFFVLLHCQILGLTLKLHLYAHR